MSSPDHVRRGVRGSTFMKIYYVYIMANKKHGTIYVGVTSDLLGRVWEHKNKLIQGFTNRYNVTKLVYWEEHNDVYEAIYREKRIKRWNRTFKYKTIEKENPNWKDLYYKYT